MKDAFSDMLEVLKWVEELWGSRERRHPVPL